MTKEQTIANIRKYAEMSKWLEACPFHDGQPFYETAHRELNDLYENTAPEVKAIDEVIYDRFVEQITDPHESIEEWEVLEEIARDLEMAP
jgi:hypothetical protein